MKKKKFITRFCAAALAAALLTGCSSAPGKEEGSVETSQSSSESSGGDNTSAEKSGESEEKLLTSQEYVEAMGHGWNLGNSFDGVDTDESKEDTGETAWGNPVVTRELLHAVKAKGFDSIRIPMKILLCYRAGYSVF